MSKYDVRFCNCGTIHFIDWDLLDNVCFTDGKLNGRELLHVCLNCGAAFIRGLDDRGDGGYDLYSSDVRETMEGVEESKYYTVLSKGVRLMMESGNYADSRRGDLYVDEDGLKKEIGDSNLTRIEGVARYVEKPEYKLRDVKSVNVNMNWLLRDITPEQAESMCGYLIKSFNWVSTQYERDFHRDRV